MWRACNKSPCNLYPSKSLLHPFGRTASKNDVPGFGPLKSMSFMAVAPGRGIKYMIKLFVGTIYNSSQHFNLFKIKNRLNWHCQFGKGQGQVVGHETNFSVLYSYIMIWLCNTPTYLCQVSWFIVRNGVGFTMDKHNPVVFLDLVGGVDLDFCCWIYWRSIHNHFIRQRRLHLSKFRDSWNISYVNEASFSNLCKP